ncbi:FecR family protein [Glycocaulis alkaliphilus]|nr:iron dicitrate transporter FecR [Glycocaulis alkaliphilus]
MLQLASAEPDWAGFQRWRDADVRHAAAFDELQGLWSQLAALKPAFASAKPFGCEQRGEPCTRAGARRFWRIPRPSSWIPKPALAGLVVACFILGAVLGPRAVQDISADHVAAIGIPTLVELADGSTVWLNTDAAINVRYRANQREVRLLRGEARFEVAGDPSRPFSVWAAGGRATALGTVFTVRREGAETLVSVSEGRVALSSPGRAASSTSGGEGAVILTAGQAARYRTGRAPGPVMAAVPSPDLWRRGVIAIDDMTLAEAFAEMDRYRAGRILLLADISRAQSVTARIAIDEIESGLDALAAAEGLHVTRISNRLVLIR